MIKEKEFSGHSSRQRSGEIGVVLKKYSCSFPFFINSEQSFTGGESYKTLVQCNTILEDALKEPFCSMVFFPESVAAVK
jgi:hypothetical protein